MLCALAEAVNGRITHSDRILRGIKSDGDPVVELSIRAGDMVISRLRHPGGGGSDRMRGIVDGLISRGHADFARIVAATNRVLAYAQAEELPEAALTPAEVDILTLLAEGLVPKEIAARSGRSVHTVRVHIANIIAKLGCHGRADAIRTASRLGLISSEPRNHNDPSQS